VKKLTWKEITVKVKDLKPSSDNPRVITSTEYDRLKQSIRDTGYHQRLVADKDLVLISGHQRLEVLLDLGVEEVEVLTPSRKLTKKEFERVMIQSNVNAGTFDFDMLANNFDADCLVDWGIPAGALGFSGPSEAEEAPEKEKKKKLCPSCGEIL
jgi:hypothetical protein